MVAPLNIDQLRNRFYIEGCPHWWAYDSNNKKTLLGKFRDDDDEIQDEDDMMDYSWMQLEDLINTYSFGSMRITAKKNPTDNIDRSINFNVKWGSNEMGDTRGTGQMGGNVAGGNNWGMMQYMLNQQQQFFNQLLQQSQENARLNFENQNLSAELEGTQEPSLQQTLLKEVIGLLKPSISPQPQVAALGTAGQRTQPTSSAGDPVAAPAKTRPVSLDAVMADLNTIKASLPEHHLNDVTRALALFVQQNTDMAKNFIAGLIKQMNGE